MTVRELRQKYLAYFVSKDHQTHPSGSLVPIDVTGRLDESLLFNGAGMVQFKPYFRGIAQPPSKRLCNAQKVLRTGDIDEVGDKSHLTFFEMMGNFSFGDYFKKGAIDLSWEFITSTEWLSLDPKKLSVTVFETDDEAFEAWAGHFRSVGIEPSCRIFRLGEETNYWPAGAYSKGPPGPCGPNTEMFYWVSPESPPPITGEGGYSVDDWLRDDDARNWMEFWNDVFIQYEWQGDAQPNGGYAKTGLLDLPFQSVDTGMGLERAATVLGGFDSVYDTDAFQPIFRAIEGLPGGSLAYGSDGPKDVAMRIVADHLRSACFCIGDGILPSNTGRGYVLRRLIRRAVLKGQRVLGFGEPFLHHLVDTVVESAGSHYSELVDKQAVIVETLRNEEALFRRTLDVGSDVLSQILKDQRDGHLHGAMAFMLYDTYGFPIEVTKELCAESGVDVDIEGYKVALAEAQERSRASDQRESVYGGVVVGIVFETDDGRATPTVFTGYDATRTTAKIVGALPIIGEDGKAQAKFAVALDQTPFYAESGGQVSDTGVLHLGVVDTTPNSLPSFDRHEQSGQILEGGLKVVDVTKQDGVFVHLVQPDSAFGHEGKDKDTAQAWLTKKLFNQKVEAVVDDHRRREVTRNHTATHLLHAALRKTLGEHVTQAGSLVSPEHLRFDFTHGKAMSPEEIKVIEELVNEEVLKAQAVTIYNDTPIEDARKMGAMALFGEKYGDRVRVVQIGGMASNEPSPSRELCGGCHVRNTGEIGLFKILHESSAASGVRRIEAVTGLGAYNWVSEQQSTLHMAADRLKSGTKDIVQAIERLYEQLREERKKRERLAQQGGGKQADIEAIGAFELAVERLEDADAKDAQMVADRLSDGHPNRVSLVVNKSDGKLLFVAKCGQDAVKNGAHAGNLVKAVATAAGGGGGGRPDFATAGGRDASKLEEAIEAGKAFLRESAS